MLQWVAQRTEIFDVEVSGTKRIRHSVTLTLPLELPSIIIAITLYLR
jgi:hypothetical protein